MGCGARGGGEGCAQGVRGTIPHLELLNVSCFCHLYLYYLQKNMLKSISRNLKILHKNFKISDFAYLEDL